MCCGIRQPTHIAVAFDVGRSFRQDRFEDYKATRERMPDELRSQIERIQEVVQTFNIPIFTAEGYEADDVLATLARQAAASRACRPSSSPAIATSCRWSKTRSGC